MKRITMMLLFAAGLAWASPAAAQLTFKKTKVNPLQRVPELIVTVKTDADDRKRAHAAEELRDFDTTKFTEIVPVLADVLLHDKKQSVRLEALASLSRIRPLSTTAGQALEKAAANDEAMRVRLHAKAALTKYHLAGYSPKKGETISTSSKMSTNEPPLMVNSSPKKGETTSTSSKVSTNEPPLIVNPPLPAPRNDDPRIPRPLPPGVASPPKAPVDGPSLFP